MNNNPLAKQFNYLSIIKFALPNIVMMIFLSLYTIIDGMFISRFVGELALSATNMFYPITSFQLALGVMLGTGGSAIIALNMGKGNTQQAKKDFTFITLVAFIVGLLFSVICIPNLNFILNFLGTSVIQIQYSTVYAKTLLLFSPIMFLQVLFQMFFVTAGKPNFGLAMNAIGGVANIILDYLFMGPMNMGVSGAALATGIGYCVPAVSGIIYFTFNKKGSLHFTKFKFNSQVLLKTCSNGSSEMVSNVATSITTFLFNIIFMHFWAENGVATIAILSYLQFVFNSLFMGFAMGISPIISYKYGANDISQLKKLFRFSIIFVFLCSISIYIISKSTISFSVSMFTDIGSSVYNLAVSGFTVYALQFLFSGFSIFSSAFFTALNNGIVSATISFSRTFIFLVGSLLILPLLFGETGVWYAAPIAELLGIIVSISFLIFCKKKYNY